MLLQHTANICQHMVVLGPFEACTLLLRLDALVGLAAGRQEVAEDLLDLGPAGAACSCSCMPVS